MGNSPIFVKTTTTLEDISLIYENSEYPQEIINSYKVDSKWRGFNWWRLLLVSYSLCLILDQVDPLLVPVFCILMPQIMAQNILQNSLISNHNDFLFCLIENRKTWKKKMTRSANSKVPLHTSRGSLCGAAGKVLSSRNWMWILKMQNARLRECNIDGRSRRCCCLFHATKRNIEFNSKTKTTSLSSLYFYRYFMQQISWKLLDPLS